MKCPPHALPHASQWFIPLSYPPLLSGEEVHTHLKRTAGNKNLSTFQLYQVGFEPRSLAPQSAVYPNELSCPLQPEGFRRLQAPLKKIALGNLLGGVLMPGVGIEPGSAT